MSVGISRAGAYLPAHRINRTTLANALGQYPLPGRRTVANGDEDSLTMAVEAALDCCGFKPGVDLDGVYFATTTPPYQEKLGSALLASVLGLPDTVETHDFTGSLRAGTQALCTALDRVSGAGEGRFLVVASDARRAEPGSRLEQVVGDGAAALVVDARSELLARVGQRSLTREIMGTWRREEDDYLQVFDEKLEAEHAYRKPVRENLEALLEEQNRDAGEVDRFVLSWPDEGSHRAMKSGLGLDDDQLHRSLFREVGHAGVAHPLLMLVDALPGLDPGQHLCLGSYGDGSDGLLFRVASESPGPSRVDEQLDTANELDSYPTFLDRKDEIKREPPRFSSSPTEYWRDREYLHPLMGLRCTQCGTVQYPKHRVCFTCQSTDEFETIPLRRRGSVYTYTLDHIENRGTQTEYRTEPTPRLVVDLEGGGRVFLDGTDTDGFEIERGMDVRLTFRRIHDGEKFHNYYWKARPPRGSNESGDSP